MVYEKITRHRNNNRKKKLIIIIRLTSRTRGLYLNIIIEGVRLSDDKYRYIEQKQYIIIYRSKYRVGVRDIYVGKLYLNCN